MITVRLMKWNRHFTSAEHKDVDITDIVLWEPPGGGWFVCAISTTDKGLPPWETEDDGDTKTYGELKWTPAAWRQQYGDMKGFPWNEPNDPPDAQVVAP